jgi:hypothetical protein
MRNTGTDMAAVREEQRRMRQLRVMVDLTAAIIRHRPLSREEAEMAVENLREQVLALFPDKGHVFDLIYRARFGRLIAERFGGGAKDMLS